MVVAELVVKQRRRYWDGAAPRAGIVGQAVQDAQIRFGDWGGPYLHYRDLENVTYWISEPRLNGDMELNPSAE
jgi:hypothetical protein